MNIIKFARSRGGDPWCTRRPKLGKGFWSELNYDKTREGRARFSTLPSWFTSFQPTCLPPVSNNILVYGPLHSFATNRLLLNQIRNSSNYRGFRNPGARIGETSCFVQTGAKISELPVLVRKVNDIFELYSRLGIPQSPHANAPTEEDKDKFLLAFPPGMDREEMEIIDGFSRCFSSSTVFRLLETIPRQEVTPRVAVHALRKIIDLENTVSAPGSMRETIRGTRKQPVSGGQDTFLRMAFMTMLLDIICDSKQPKVILDGLGIVMRDPFPADLAVYKERLLDQVLVCTSEGLFSVMEVCRAITILSQYYEDRKRCLETADKLWFGIVDQYKHINDPQTKVAVFGALPSLNKSRHIVMKVLEKKGLENWEQYTTSDIIEILRVIVDIKYDRVNPNFMKMISEWLALNIHQVKESEMLAIIYSLMQLDYMDTKLVSTMEKLIKHKGCKIQEIDLVSVICDVCAHFRIRSAVVMEGASQYLVAHSSRLSAPQIYSIARIFGHLDFHPTTGFKFWREVEQVLEEKFVQFPPKDIIQLLLSFLAIEKYPLNFNNKVFNPHFLDRLHSQQEEDVALSRQQLKLYDAGMKLECRGYGGPYLPKDKSYKQIDLDARVKKMANVLFEPLGELLGDYSRLGTHVVLSSLPLHPSYIVDMMIYPTRAEALLRFGFKTENSSNIAVLVHLPEHYDRSGHHLVGEQVLRVRHLKTMGFRVMTVNYATAAKLQTNHQQLKDYLEERYKIAVKPAKT